MGYRQRNRQRVADRFRAATARDHVIFTGRGATAIWAALKAWGFTDQPVLIPANTCYIVLWAVLLSGNRPILVDVDPATGMITPETLSAAGIERPTAVIPCHLYGLPAPMAEICAWATEHGAKVIEDAAQAMIMPDSRVGSWGDASIFSFGSGKLVDVGYRGALLCSDAELTAEIKRHVEPLPLYADHLAELEKQWLTIYWATHQFETENIPISSLYPTLFQIYRNITLYNAPSQGFVDVYQRLSTFLSSSPASDFSSVRRQLRANEYDRLVSGTWRTLPRADDTVLWRYPLLVPPEVRGDLFDELQARRLDVTRWYPSLQAMAHALCPKVAQPPTPHADHFAECILNLPLTWPGDPPERIIDAILDYRNEQRL
ncbi:MAG: DegT/DnrJ/EryC1/StrS aminotransferase family protein [Chloroflexi bacterium]|uniref:DegT/DnrJ/EryC1/StrS family aminotransferase n=1 Tax=Candidatus Flexifilum breve TaxID=3140694 RepID=UPI003135451B|nr:DegT/DnrJ/EryC1/StrS aminotransferase family protein [Chloroflexota bacterium]